MNYQQYILEIGFGVDLHGGDETKAAERAVRDAISRVSMVGLGSLFKAKGFKEVEKALLVDVTISAPNPERVDGKAVLKMLPEGRRRIRVVKGGAVFPTEDTPEESKTHNVIIAACIIVVLVDLDMLKT